MLRALHGAGLMRRPLSRSEASDPAASVQPLPTPAPSAHASLPDVRLPMGRRLTSLQELPGISAPTSLENRIAKISTRTYLAALSAYLSLGGLGWNHLLNMWSKAGVEPAIGASAKLLKNVVTYGGGTVIGGLGLAFIGAAYKGAAFMQYAEANQFISRGGLLDSPAHHRGTIQVVHFLNQVVALLDDQASHTFLTAVKTALFSANFETTHADLLRLGLTDQTGLSERSVITQALSHALGPHLETRQTMAHEALALLETQDMGAVTHMLARAQLLHSSNFDSYVHYLRGLGAFENQEPTSAQAMAAQALSGAYLLDSRGQSQAPAAIALMQQLSQIMPPTQHALLLAQLGEVLEQEGLRDFADLSAHPEPQVSLPAAQRLIDKIPALKAAMQTLEASSLAPLTAWEIAQVQEILEERSEHYLALTAETPSPQQAARLREQCGDHEPILSSNDYEASAFATVSLSQHAKVLASPESGLGSVLLGLRLGLYAPADADRDSLMHALADRLILQARSARCASQITAQTKSPHSHIPSPSAACLAPATRVA
jgi:hypothetical protein